VIKYQSKKKKTPATSIISRNKEVGV